MHVSPDHYIRDRPLQMGHLRAYCPNKISKPYPFNDVLVSSMYIGVNECCDEVCSPSLCVDNPSTVAILTDVRR